MFSSVVTVGGKKSRRNDEKTVSSQLYWQHARKERQEIRRGRRVAPKGLVTRAAALKLDARDGHYDDKYVGLLTGIVYDKTGASSTAIGKTSVAPLKNVRRPERLRKLDRSKQLAETIQSGSEVLPFRVERLRSYPAAGADSPLRRLSPALQKKLGARTAAVEAHKLPAMERDVETPKHLLYSLLQVALLRRDAGLARRCLALLVRSPGYLYNDFWAEAAELLSDEKTKEQLLTLLGNKFYYLPHPVAHAVKKRDRNDVFLIARIKNLLQARQFREAVNLYDEYYLKAGFKELPDFHLLCGFAYLRLSLEEEHSEEVYRRRAGKLFELAAEAGAEVSRDLLRMAQDSGAFEKLKEAFKTSADEDEAGDVDGGSEASASASASEVSESEASEAEERVSGERVRDDSARKFTFGAPTSESSDDETFYTS